MTLRKIDRTTDGLRFVSGFEFPVKSRNRTSHRGPERPVRTEGLCEKEQ